MTPKDITLKPGDKIGIIEYMGKDYFGFNDPLAPFKNKKVDPIKPEPNVLLFEVIKDKETIQVDLDYLIQDANAKLFYPIIGGRPRNIVKR